jgi:FKBP-type peptidyl-prolyl cis-trans isomerase FkpA
MSVTAVPLQPVKRAYKVWLWLGVIAAIALAFGLAWAGTREQVVRTYDNDAFLAWNKGRSGVQTTSSGLQFQVLKEGEGPKAADGDGLTIDLVGKKRDGTIFQPKGPVQLMVGQAVPGFNEAMKLMSKGTKLRAWIPPSLGYGQAGAQHPLHDQVLVFDMEATEIVSAATIQQMMMQQMMQQQMQGGGGQGGPQGGPAPQGGPPPQGGR